MPGKVDLSGLSSIGSLVGVLVFVMIFLVVIIVVISTLVKSKNNGAKTSRKGGGLVSTSGTIMRFDVDPQNAFNQYPVVSFFDEETGEFVEGTAEKVKLRKQPRVGETVNITYRKIIKWGCPVYVVHIV